MKKVWYYQFPIGELGIAESGNGICGIFMKNENNASQFEEKETKRIKEAAAQLSEYFDGKRTSFEIKFELLGTDFQKKVWDILCSIPYGETKSYEDVAVLAGNAKACRAVGMANNKNPVMIMIPCHRVVGKNGSLTGYAGGLGAKEFLLNLEKGRNE